MACGIDIRRETQYRKYAADALDLARRQPDSSDKSRLLVMAEAWLDLADRIVRRSSNRQVSVDHPLVEKVLGPDQPRAD